MATETFENGLELFFKYLEKDLIEQKECSFY